MSEFKSPMKGIVCCAECAHFDHKKYECTRGCADDRDSRSPFYADCKLPEVKPIEPAAWVYGENDIPHCSHCGHTLKDKAAITPFCPMCGHDMSGGH